MNTTLASGSHEIAFRMLPRAVDPLPASSAGQSINTDPVQQAHPMHSTLNVSSKTSSVRCFSSAALLFLLTIAQLVAAETAATGVINGTVLNKATGEYVPDARVEIDGTNLTTNVTRSGSFSIRVPAGQQTLVVSSIGLDPVTVPITVEPGQTITRTIELSSDVYVLDQFIVSGDREARALALQAQRQSPNLKTVVSADAYGNPAANPGELINRLPEVTADIMGSEVRTLFVRGMNPEFTQLQIDGERVASSTGTSAQRTFQIEQYGTANIASVEVIKAVTPDMDAGAIAGVINLISKRAYDSPRRKTTLTLGTLWKDRHGVSDQSPLKDRPDGLDIVGLSHADVYSVFGGSRNLGISANYSRRASSTTQDEVGPAGLSFGSNDFITVPEAFAIAGVAPLLERQWGTGDLLYDAVAESYGINVDYKVSDRITLWAKASSNTNVQYQHYYRFQVNTAALPAGANPFAAAFAPGSTYLDQTVLPRTGSVANSISGVLDKHSENYQTGAGADIKFPEQDMLLTLDGRYSWATIKYPGLITVNSRVNAPVGWNLKRDPSQVSPEFTQTAGPSVYDPDNYNLLNYTRDRYTSPNELYSFRADIRKDFQWSFPTYFKTGVKMTDDSRESKRSASLYTWNGGTGMGAFLGPFYKQGDNDYGPFPFVTVPGEGEPVVVKQGSWTQTASDAYASIDRTLGSRADASERITAGYVMGNTQLGPVRLLAGIRFERTEVSTSSLRRVLNTSPGPDGTSNIGSLPVAENVARALRRYPGDKVVRTNRYDEFFPGVHAVYEPIRDLVIKASINRSITRPQVTNLLPNLQVNDIVQTLSGGNPELKPYRALNFELGVARYFAEGVIEVNAFRKDIDDYFSSRTTIVGAGANNGFDGDYEGYSWTRPENMGSATIQGLSFNFQYQFRKLPGLLNGLGAGMNFTYLETEGDFGTIGVTRRQLSNFTPRSGNVSVSWVGKGLELRLLANWRGTTLFSGTENSVASTYIRERLLIGLKTQYTINKTFDIFLDVDNLTNEPTSPYGVLGGDLFYYAARQGTTYVMGLRTRF